MNVSLTPELERRITEKVASGLYTSASEVVRESLRLLFEAEGLKERRHDLLRADIRLGLEQLDRGEGVSGDQVLTDVTKRLEGRRQT
jgi:antitoxin ParD1/3/4